MKIAILSCCNFSVIGGAERFIIDVARALDATIVSIGHADELDTTYYTDDIKFKFMEKNIAIRTTKTNCGFLVLQ